MACCDKEIVLKRFVVTVQMNTDTVGHNPLCSLASRGYKAYAEDMSFLHTFQLFETVGVEVTGPEEGMAFEVLASHPAVLEVYSAS